MHVIFDRTHVTVCNVQEHLLLPARLVTGLYWTIAVLLIICRYTTCNRLVLARQSRYARLVSSPDLTLS